MIEDYYTRAFSVYRMATTGYISQQTLIGSFNGHLQQSVQLEDITPSLREYVTHAIWCAPETDVKVGDKLTDTEYEYMVRAIQDNGYVGGNTHLELLVSRTEVESA